MGGRLTSAAKMRASWQRHIFPEGFPSSIVCAGAFHFRVRDGNGWFRSAPVTKGFLVGGSIHHGHAGHKRKSKTTGSHLHQRTRAATAGIRGIGIGRCAPLTCWKSTSRAFRHHLNWSLTRALSRRSWRQPGSCICCRGSRSMCDVHREESVRWCGGPGIRIQRCIAAADSLSLRLTAI